MTILTVSTFTGIIPYVTPTPPSAPTFTMPDPMSYEFQVVEYMEGDRVAKVALQVKRNTHDQFGNIKLAGFWQEVPRIRIKL
jgi:hypothetical protein